MSSTPAGLLISWATPEASMPMAAIFSICTSCACARSGSNVRCRTVSSSFFGITPLRFFQGLFGQPLLSDVETTAIVPMKSPLPSVSGAAEIKT